MRRQWRRWMSRNRDDGRSSSAWSEMRRTLEARVRSVLAALNRRTTRGTRQGIIFATVCVLLIALVTIALLWSDRFSSGIQATLARLAQISTSVEPTPGCPTADGCAQQSPGERDSASATTPAPPAPTVYIDPGHGGVDLGAVGIAEDGTYVFEKDVALALAMGTADRLRAVGINVVLSRVDDSLLGTVPSDYSDDGEKLTDAGLSAELQRRIEKANASGAQLFLSIHLNGLDDPSVAGAATIYCENRPFSGKNRRFATLIQGTVIAALRSEGYTTPDLGVVDDEDYLGSDKHLAILGPTAPGKPHASNMPGALFEAFYLSNPLEVSAAIDPDTQDLIATALARAIEQHLKDEGHQISQPATVGP
ncbi:MAG: N-acetylmuramoyl-L-alanine amidase family protein, partial [Chloroflexota bacterium]